MARFFDGVRASPHDATPSLAGDALLIRATDGTILATWPIADIRARDRPDRSGMVTLSRRDTPARLEVSDAALLHALSGAGVRRLTSRRWHPRHWIAFCAALLAMLPGSVLLLILLPQMVAPALPAMWEDRFGAWAERSVVGDHRRCAAADGQHALETLVARLQRAAEVDRPVRIAVLDEPTVNAVTLPGGRILVMRGLIDKVDDGTELAGVIAHEMGHVAHRDPTTLLLRRMGLGMVAAAVGWNDTLGSAAGVAQTFVALSYSRSAEAAADAAAEKILTRAGLRADGLGRFFARMETLEGRGGDIPWLATHPPTEQRRAQATRSTAGTPPFSDAEWAAVRAICR